MSGALQTSGDGGGFVTCGVCGADAAGPCARCRIPLCGDCCVLTEGGAGPWAVCKRCARRGGNSLGRGWRSLAPWLVAPLIVLSALLALLHWLSP